MEEVNENEESDEVDEILTRRKHTEKRAKNRKI